MRDLIITSVLLFSVTFTLHAKSKAVGQQSYPLTTGINDYYSYIAVQDSTGKEPKIESIEIEMNDDSSTVTLKGTVVFKDSPVHVSVSSTSTNTKEALRIAYKSFQKLNDI